MEEDKQVINISTLSSANTDTITITSSSVGDVYLDTTGTISTYDVDSHWISLSDTIDLSNITIREPVEFEDCMPDVAKVEDMCNDYPGLRKAYENFKAVYKMVHQDWQGRQDADDDWPF